MKLASSGFQLLLLPPGGSCPFWLKYEFWHFWDLEQKLDFLHHCYHFRKMLSLGCTRVMSPLPTLRRLGLGNTGDPPPSLFSS